MPDKESKLGIRRGMALAGTVFVMAALTSSGGGQEIQSAIAGDGEGATTAVPASSMETLTPVSLAPEGSLATRIANEWLTATAVVEKKTATAVAEHIDALLGTPTKTLTPAALQAPSPSETSGTSVYPLSQEDVNRFIEDSVQRSLEVYRRATANAPTQTPIVIREKIVERVQEGPTWGSLLIGLGGFLLGYALANTTRIITIIRRR